MLLPGCREQSNNTGSPLSEGFSLNDNLIRTGKSVLQEGDLLIRSDDDFESLSLQNFSQRDRTYSHSGIVLMENGGWWVYHSMAGAENPVESVKKSPSTAL